MPTHVPDEIWEDIVEHSPLVSVDLSWNRMTESY